MVRMSLQARNLSKERGLRAQRKNQGMFIVFTWVLFSCLCWNHDRRSLSPKTTHHATGIKHTADQNHHPNSTEAQHFESDAITSTPEKHSFKSDQTKDAVESKVPDNFQTVYLGKPPGVPTAQQLTDSTLGSSKHESFTTPNPRTELASDYHRDFSKNDDRDSTASSTNTMSAATEFTPIHGGAVFRIQPKWNRLHSPWFRPTPVHLPSPKESNYRYLYSATRVGTSDGIGHSMGVTNRDFNLAITLNLTYTHRVGTYSSLTSNNTLAVEDFFGWGEAEIPRTDIQKHGCFPRNNKWPSQDAILECHICEMPMKNGTMKIRHLTDIPADLSSYCHVEGEGCMPMKMKFLSAHQESHTIFQASRQACSPPATDANFIITKNLFFHKYWNRHGQLPWSPKYLPGSKSRRHIRYKAEELNIAVHIRRGDFLDPEIQGKRDITKDGIFAKVITDVLSIVDRVGGIFSNVPVTVHIYSEGKLTKQQVKSIHAIELQDKNYYDSNGTARNEGWWKQQILQTKASPSLQSPYFLGERIKVVLHISEDTLLCLHEMISADIFIGSKSGLSNALVWSLSRGVVLIPHASTINNERGKKGEICCSVPFANNNGDFDYGLFGDYWAMYVKANAASAHHAHATRNH